MKSPPSVPTETCYMCEAIATTREHVPPKCIFPEGDEFRMNLIKVPSCDAHNGRKSIDDELLRQVLTFAPGINELGLRVVEAGVIPGLERREHLLKTFLPNLRRVEIDGDETASFTIDNARFDSSIGSIVRGLYFHETKRKLLAEIDVVWGALGTAQYAQVFFEIVRCGKQRYPPMRRGANPRVFKYDFRSEGNFGLCRLCFYEGHPIYAVWEDADDRG